MLEGIITVTIIEIQAQVLDFQDEGEDELLLSEIIVLRVIIHQAIMIILVVQLKIAIKLKIKILIVNLQLSLPITR